MAQQKKTLKIPKDLTPSERIELSDDIIDLIVKRTQRGRDVNNSKFKPYSKEYAAAKGVSRGSVDLTVTGDMLDAVKLLTHRSGSITIGIEKGATDRNGVDLNAKAEGNQKVNGREFIGLTQADLDNLIDRLDG